MATNFPNISNLPGGYKGELRVKKPSFLLPVNFDGAGVEWAINKLGSVLGPRPEGIEIYDVSDSGSYGLPGRYVHLKWQVKKGYGADATIALNQIKSLLSQAKSQADIDRIKSQYATVLSQNPTLNREVSTLTSQVTSRLPSAPALPGTTTSRLPGGASVTTAAQKALFQQIAQKMVSSTSITQLNQNFNLANDAVKAGTITDAQYAALRSSFGAISQGVQFGKLGTLSPFFPSVSIPPRLTANLPGAPSLPSAPSVTSSPSVQLSNFNTLKSQVINAKSIADLERIKSVVSTYQSQGKLSASYASQLMAAIAMMTTKLQQPAALPSAPSVPSPIGATATQALKYDSWKSAISRASYASIQDYPSRILADKNSNAITEQQYRDLQTILQARMQVLAGEEKARLAAAAAKLTTYESAFKQKMASLDQLNIASLDPRTASTSQLKGILTTLANFRNTVPLDWPPEYQREYAQRVDSMYRQVTSLLSQTQQLEQMKKELEEKLPEKLPEELPEVPEEFTGVGEAAEEYIPVQYVPAPAPAPAAGPTTISVIAQPAIPQAPQVAQPSVISFGGAPSAPGPTIITLPGGQAPAPTPAPAAGPGPEAWAFNTPMEGPPLPRSLGIKWPWVK